MDGTGSDQSFEPEDVEPKIRFQATLQKFAYAASPDNKPIGSNLVAKNSTPISLLAQANPPMRSPTTRSTGRASITDFPGAARSSNSKSQKRKAKNSELEEDETPTKAVKKRSTLKERSADDPFEPPNKLVDSLQPGLLLVLIGLNPGLTTALTGHAYAHPSNGFWKLLKSSGLTPILHKPKETRSLMELYSIGNTNLCARATRGQDGLTKEEKKEGANILEQKIFELKPEAVCIIGKGIWDEIYKVKTGKNLKKADFVWGWQDESLWLGRRVDQSQVIWEGARTFVTTSSSGLDASTTLEQKTEIWKPLGKWFNARKATIEKENGPGGLT